jgi:hypothetical protein
VRNLWQKNQNNCRWNHRASTKAPEKGEEIMRKSKKLTLKTLMNANPENQVEETEQPHSNSGTTVSLVRRVDRPARYPFKGKNKGYQQIRIVFVS